MSLPDGYPAPVAQLAEALRLLPGVGRRGAERLTLALLEWEPDDLRSFGTLLQELPDKVGLCPECGMLAEKGEKCAFCRDPRRDDSLLCVVETTAQVHSVEASGHYRGRYHILGGRLSPRTAELDGGLNLDSLLRRAASGTVKEIILALSPDVEGRATACFLSEQLSGLPVKLSRPALGLPAGSNLSYADAATVSAALSGRIPMTEP